MTVTTIVHVIRHGEVYNPGGILYGRLPGYKLSPLGEQMAKVTAQHLTGRDVTHLFVSPMERAQQTMEPFAEQFGLEPTVDERLIEATNLFEGKPFGPGDGLWRHRKYWHYLRNPFRPSWGEPYREQAARMLSIVTDARKAAAGHEAVCISHQSPIVILRRHLEKKTLWHDPRRRQCALASVTSVRFEDDEFVGLEYADPAAPLIAQSKTAQTERGA
ncbi:histidine phosphatase family protein [Cryptosporangium phraense]|uniref:Histidine phosphatase family protein n=1 Tax=Cryptosporangium phraense TaxID=2593070 RepID=A0A545AEJ0_9ACTN|nr:histidine phosphatase family protein [Cryptosporangium phraense]TQS39744.1 histidine phosphatase family protein [Cryptosporangium phraense]